MMKGVCSPSPGVIQEIQDTVPEEDAGLSVRGAAQNSLGFILDELMLSLALNPLNVWITKPYKNWERFILKSYLWHLCAETAQHLLSQNGK